MGSKRVPRALLAAGPVLAESGGHRRLAVGVVARAGQPAVRPDGAAVGGADADRDVAAGGRGGLAVAVQAPAGDRGVRPDPAAVVVEAAAERDETAGGRSHLPVRVFAPAGEGAGGPDRAGEG